MNVFKSQKTNSHLTGLLLIKIELENIEVKEPKFHYFSSTGYQI